MKNAKTNISYTNCAQYHIEGDVNKQNFLSNSLQVYRQPLYCTIENIYHRFEH